jgi:hypothetical protein
VHRLGNTNNKPGIRNRRLIKQLGRELDPSCVHSIRAVTSTNAPCVAIPADEDDRFRLRDKFVVWRAAI